MASKTVELTDYVTCEAALREADLKQSLYDEGALLMHDVLVTLHGEAHRQRRLTEMRVFRRDFFRKYEAQVIPQIFSEVMSAIDDPTHVELVDLNYRFMVYLAVSFAGIDRQTGTVEELDTLVYLLRMFGVAATLGQAKESRDKEEAKQQVAAAIEQFDQQFLQPSIKRRRMLLAEVEAGEQSADSLPMDVLTVLLQDEAKLSLEADMLLRETAFYFLASAHTSVHSLGHAVDHLLNWCETHAGARETFVSDPLSVQRFVHESFRLHPSSPVAKRLALSEIKFLDGQTASLGDTVIINLRQANRDTNVFGADAEVFNPQRNIKQGTSETGITFGIGMHACLGKNLAAGSLPKVSKQESSPTLQQHQLGTVPWICHQLLKAGIQKHPQDKAQLDQAIERETWAKYPVYFDSIN